MRSAETLDVPLGVVSGGKALTTCPAGAVHVVVWLLLSDQYDSTHAPSTGTVVPGVVCVALDPDVSIAPVTSGAPATPEYAANDMTTRAALDQFNVTSAPASVASATLVKTTLRVSLSSSSPSRVQPAGSATVPDPFELVTSTSRSPSSTWFGTAKVWREELDAVLYSPDVRKAMAETIGAGETEVDAVPVPPRLSVTVTEAE